MNRRTLARVFALTLVGASASLACSPSSPQTAEDDSALWANSTAKWRPNARGRMEISVCWEDGGFARDKRFIERTVRGTWSAVAPVDFVGWGPCGSADVRIRIADENPGVEARGRAIRGIPGG